MTSELLPWFESCIREGRLLPRGAKLVIGVSGGLDSVLLLHLLHDLASRWSWRLQIAHFNHRLRGRASGLDQRFVNGLARRLGWPCVVGNEDVQKVASDRGVSVEVAARACRHAFLARVARQLGSRRVVLAHHGNDQVELFFLRVLRGSGLEGLQGMHAVSPSPADPRVRLVRPLLEVPRDRLFAEAAARNLRWREDQSNRDVKVLRNRVRHELLPWIQRRYQPGIVGVVLRTMSILRGEAELLAETDQVWRERLRGQGWAGLPIAVQRRRIVSQLLHLGVSTEYGLIERLRTQPGRQWSVGPDRTVLLDPRGRIRVTEEPDVHWQQGEVIGKLTSRSGRLELGQRTICWHTRSCRGSGDWRQHPGPGREVFDADRVGLLVRLRYWQPGDRFQPIGFKVAAKLQDLLVAKRIPRAVRRRLLVAESESAGVFWVEGLRIGHECRVRGGTRRLLIWAWSKPEA